MFTGQLKLTLNDEELYELFQVRKLFSSGLGEKVQVMWEELVDNISRD